MKIQTVKISVSGGVAYMDRKPAHVRVIITDHDNDRDGKPDPDTYPARGLDWNWYVVTGRRCGDDEDSYHTTRCKSPQAAMRSFKQFVMDSDDRGPSDDDTNAIFINACIKCGPTRPEVC